MLSLQFQEAGYRIRTSAAKHFRQTWRVLASLFEALIDAVKHPLATLSNALLFCALSASTSLYFAQPGRIVTNSVLVFVVCSIAVAVACHPRLSTRHIAWRLSLFGIVAVILGGLLWEFFWVPSRAHLISELRDLARQGNWQALGSRLDKLEADGESSDIELYFRAWYWDAASRGPDPESLLVLITPESSLFYRAQWLRFQSYMRRSPDDLVKAQALADSLAQARYYSPIYFRLRLKYLEKSFPEVSKFYDEFKSQYSGFFDFNSMKNVILLQTGRPFRLDYNDISAIPDTVSLFLMYQILTSHNAGCAKEKTKALEAYDRLIAESPILKSRINPLKIDRKVVNAHIANARMLPFPKIKVIPMPVTTPTCR
ncbi:MAG: hypothetical protein WEC76_05170 [Steroidobacteraceae bacterium]